LTTPEALRLATGSRQARRCWLDIRVFLRGRVDKSRGPRPSEADETRRRREAPILVARKPRRRPASRLDTRSNWRRAPRSRSLMGGWTLLSTRPLAGEMQGGSPWTLSATCRRGGDAAPAA